MYSKRSGTPAEKMPDQVPMEVKKQRVNKLLELQKTIEAKKLKRFLNQTLTVLMTEQKDGKTFAKTDCGINVIIQNAQPEDFKVDFVNVEVVDIKNTKLIANLK